MDNLFNISAMEKSATARAVDTPTPAVEAPAQPASPAADPAPAPDPNNPSPSTDQPAASPAAAPADPLAPQDPPSSPTDTNTNQDPAPGPLPAADPAVAAPDADTEAAREKQRIYLEAQDTARKALLDELGVQSIDDLKTWRKPEAEETPEQKQQREDLKRINVTKYAITKMNMTADDFSQIQQATQATDDALVFAAFRDKWLPQAQNDPSFSGKDLEVEARVVFEQMFHLNSENEYMQRMGAQSLKESADQIRGAQQARYAQAERQYDDHIQLRQNMGNFKNLLEGKLAAIPTERTFNLDDGEKIVFQLSKLDRDALRSELLTQEVFDTFVAEGSQKATELIDKRIENYIRSTYHDDILSTTVKTVRDRAAAKAVVGAKAPFASPAAPAIVPDTGQITKEDDAKVASLAQGFR